MMTPSEMENCPRCRYTDFSKCTGYKELEKLAKGSEELRRKRCLWCSMSGIREALVRNMPTAATLCFAALERILKEMDLL